MLGTWKSIWKKHLWPFSQMAGLYNRRWGDACCAGAQVAALKEGKIKKPVVAWVSGTCAKLFKSEVQFGHAGAKSGGQAESAQVTNSRTDVTQSLLETP